jgi:hypothetical protein
MEAQTEAQTQRLQAMKKPYCYGNWWSHQIRTRKQKYRDTTNYEKTITARIQGEKWLDTYLAGLLDLVLERNLVVGEDCLQDTAVERKYK